MPMELLPVWTMLGRLGLALLLGALIGLEREQRERPAGMRTHILVVVSNCLVMMVAVAFTDDSTNPARVAQGALAGIGFIGAGTIIRRGISVEGLTTAASVWTAAAIGLAVGVGWYAAAVAASVTAVLTLTLLRRLERRISPRELPLRLSIELREGVHFPDELLTALREYDVAVAGLDMRVGEATEVRRVEALLQLPHWVTGRTVVAMVSQLASVARAEPLIVPGETPRTDIE